MNTTEVLKIATAIAETLEPHPSPGVIQPLLPRDGLPEKVLIRTVTHYHVGRVVEVNDRWIVLDEAAWVASTGRFNEALTSGSLDEVEPFMGRVWVTVGSIVDVTEWPHPLFTKVK